MQFNREFIHELIVPIFKTSMNTDDIERYQYLGTGFILNDNILLTCWHVLKDVNLKKDEQISIVVVKEDGSDHKVFKLVEFEQDLNNTDIAIGLHPFKTSNKILKYPTKKDYPFGTNIWTYGYPETKRKENGERLIVPPQFFRGYITRTLFFSENREYENIPSYEINMPFPKGLSGAPICTENMEVIGIAYGSNDIATIEEFSETKIKDSEEFKIYEKQRIVSYGLAHHTTSLLEIRSSKLEDSEYLFKFKNKD